MDWNAKWDWENLIIFNSKIIESPWKQPMDYVIEGEGEIDVGSFNLFRGGGGGSGSDLAHGSSLRISVSASTDSSSKEVLKTSEIAFEGFHSFPGDFSKNNEFAEAKLAGTSPTLESSVGSGELVIGLKLGKRTYFENNFTGANARTSSFSVTPVSSAASTVKKIKSSCQTTSLRCEVEGCNLDLSTVKEYYRKHRVCEIHSKCSKVVVRGLERRFCQQCSRFHSLSEFDEKKRSCRRRLFDHNARRRKPQQNVIQFNSARLDGRQQMSFVMNNMPPVHNRSSVIPTWESTGNSKFMVTNGYSLKSDKTGGIDGELQMPCSTKLPHAIGVFGQNSNRLSPSKGAKAQVFSQGLKESMLSSKPNEAPDLLRALSLLSTDSWGSEPVNIALDHPIHANLTAMPQPLMQSVPQGLPLASSEYWHTERSTDSRYLHTLTPNDSDRFQDIPLFKAPYENGLFSNLLN